MRELVGSLRGCGHEWLVSCFSFRPLLSARVHFVPTCSPTSAPEINSGRGEKDEVDEEEEVVVERTRFMKNYVHERETSTKIGKCVPSRQEMDGEGGSISGTLRRVLVTGALN